MKKLILTTVLYIVLSMAIAFPWHMVLFHDHYLAMGAMPRAEPIIPLGILAMLIQGLAIGILYPCFCKGVSTLRSAMLFSAMFGLVVYSIMGLATAAKFEIEPVPTFLFLSLSFQVVQFLVFGVALAWIHRSKDL